MKTLNSILGYLPYVLAGVMAVEQTVSSAPGATKKALVLSAVTAATQVGEQVPDAHVQAISHLIDSIVSQLNAAGVFGHAPTPIKPASSTTAVID